MVKRVVVEVDDETHLKLKTRVASEGKTIKEIIQMLLRTYLIKK